MISAIYMLVQCCSAQSAYPAYEIERTQVVAIQSKILKRTYDLYVKLPPTYGVQSTRRYPVIFLNDARYSFPLVSSLTRQLGNGGKIEESVIVGISYSKGDDGDVSRTRDYTPTHSPTEQIGHSAAAKWASGEAPAYLRFVTEEVFPFVAKNYRADMSKKTYAGHSFGGLFGAYVLMAAPTTFENYVLSDPSLWYDNRAVFALARESRARVNVLVVSSNPKTIRQATAQQTEPPFGMSQNAQQFAMLLTKQFDRLSRIDTQIIDGEIHETIFPIAMSHGLLLFHGK